MLRIMLLSKKRLPRVLTETVVERELILRAGQSAVAAVAGDIDRDRIGPGENRACSGPQPCPNFPRSPRSRLVGIRVGRASIQGDDDVGVVLTTSSYGDARDRNRIGMLLSACDQSR